jgi:hypothetical protein
MYFQNRTRVFIVIVVIVSPACHHYQESTQRNESKDMSADKINHTDFLVSYGGQVAAAPAITYP